MTSGSRLAAAAALLFSRAAGAQPAFEVASILPNAPIGIDAAEKPLAN